MQGRPAGVFRAKGDRGEVGKAPLQLPGSDREHRLDQRRHRPRTAAFAVARLDQLAVASRPSEGEPSHRASTRMRDAIRSSSALIRAAVGLFSGHQPHLPGQQDQTPRPPPGPESPAAQAPRPGRAAVAPAAPGPQRPTARGSSAAGPRVRPPPGPGAARSGPCVRQVRVSHRWDHRLPPMLAMLVSFAPRPGEVQPTLILGRGRQSAQTPLHRRSQLHHHGRWTRERRERDIGTLPPKRTSTPEAAGILPNHSNVSYAEDRTSHLA
jgi:hypothetical protein